MNFKKRIQELKGYSDAFIEAKVYGEFKQWVTIKMIAREIELMRKFDDMQKNPFVKSITKVLSDKLPDKAFRRVQVSPSAFGGYYISILIAASNTLINDVRGQYPQLVSLSLDLSDLTLEVQPYCGSGGNGIYIEPNPNDPKEKHLAMKRVKIPFRTPNAGEVYILKAIGTFADRWLKALAENIDVLTDKNIVNYDELLESYDLFENYKLLTKEVQDVITEFVEENMIYDNCALFVEKLQEVGYTCEYDLSGTCYGLKKTFNYV